MYDGTEWCNTCAGAVKIKVPSGDWVQVDPMTNTTKYFDGTDWILIDCCPEITIGDQTWTGCNLDVTTYRNGDIIPQVEDPTEWANLTTGAWCYYDNSAVTGETYGKLYNWYALNDPRGIAPTGYHVPTEAEWTILTDYLGGGNVAGGKLKEVGLSHWNNPNEGATNSSGFTALPGGQRSNFGNYEEVGNFGAWWSSTEYGPDDAFIRDISSGSGSIAVNSANSKHFGLSVRLVKGDPPVPCINCVSGDITIGAQVWAQCNLDVTTYRNGDVIPEVQDPAVWASLTTGAWCWYNNDSANGPTYGKLYNWHAVNDPRELAPVGYHVPTDTELTTLTDYLGGSTVAGGAMKEVGLCHWNSPNINATNSSGFTGLPGGDRSASGSCDDIGHYGYWWSSSEYSTGTAWYRLLNFNNGSVGRSIYDERGGLSVRLIKD
jgi:uncharacterized protein (TIGR02145 family)